MIKYIVTTITPEVLDVIIELIYNINPQEKRIINFFRQTKKRTSKFKKYGNLYIIIQLIMYYGVMPDFILAVGLNVWKL